MTTGDTGPNICGGLVFLETQYFWRPAEIISVSPFVPYITLVCGYGLETLSDLRRGVGALLRAAADWGSWWAGPAVATEAATTITRFQNILAAAPPCRPL